MKILKFVNTEIIRSKNLGFNKLVQGVMVKEVKADSRSKQVHEFELTRRLNVCDMFLVLLNTVNGAVLDQIDTKSHCVNFFPHNDCPL